VTDANVVRMSRDWCECRVTDANGRVTDANGRVTDANVA
jgi:hypothetical protein